MMRSWAFWTKDTRAKIFCALSVFSANSARRFHPTFVPFTPWTTVDGFLDLLRVIAQQGVIENVAPIQLGIRLLIPEGSRMLELEDVRRLVGPFDPQSLAYPWKNADPRLDTLSETVQEIAAGGGAPERIAAGHVRAHLESCARRRQFARAPKSTLRRNRQVGVPFLSEPWYCCARADPRSTCLHRRTEAGPKQSRRNRRRFV